MNFEVGLNHSKREENLTVSSTGRLIRKSIVLLNQTSLNTPHVNTRVFLTYYTSTGNVSVIFADR